MHLALIDWIIIAVSFLLYLAIGIAYSRKASGSLDNFFLGGRNLPWYIAGLSMVATTFAADTPLAVAELVGTKGIAGNWLWWSFLAGGMLTTFFFANLWRRSGVITEVEMIEMRYSGPPAIALRGFKAVYLGLFMNCIIIAWVNVAMMSILQVFFDLTAGQALFYTAMAMVFAATYSSMSGLMGIAVTDAVQFFIAMAGCIILAILVVNSDQIGGITGLTEKLTATNPEALNFLPTIGSGGDTGRVLGLTFAAFFSYLGIQWWSSWYPGAEPGGGGYVAQRMMSTRSEKDAVYATLFFQVAHYCLRPWPWIMVGLCAIILYPALSAEEMRLGYVYAMKDFLPPGLKGLLLVAFFAAYLSTISTQLNWGASYVVNDLYKRFIARTRTEAQLVFASRVATLIIMLLGLAVTTQIKSISGTWEFIMQCGAGLGLVLILRWYWWRINAWSEITATVAPFAGYALAKLVFKIEPDFVLLFVTSFTTICWVTVTFITPPTDFDTLKNFYLKIRPDGNWKPIQEFLSLQKVKSGIGNLAVCWLSGITFTYGVLFFIGKVIFRSWTEAGLLLVLILFSFAVFRTYVKKTAIFGE
jgi:solute:Na+ symporter, SSS family